MNKFLNNQNYPILAALSIVAVLFVLPRTPQPEPAPRTMYMWVDSLRTTTAVVDCVFSQEWEQVVIKADSQAVWLKLGAPDTTDWASREWYRLDAGESISIGPSTRLRRVAKKADISSCTVWFVGYKSKSQY